VVVTGPPGSGKTMLARPLAEAAGLPLITKDDLKVILYEQYGWGGRERDRRASDAAYELMYQFAEALLARGLSLVLESNFRPEAAARISGLRIKHRFRIFQIRCTASRRVLMDRLERRARSASRHPGHEDSTDADHLAEMLRSGARLELDGEFVEVDTSQPANGELESLVENLARRVAPG
jgi:predicted kinase